MAHANTFVTNWISILALHALIRPGLYAFTLISLGVLFRNMVALFTDERIAKMYSSQVSFSRARNSLKSIASPVPIVFNSSWITLYTFLCAAFLFSSISAGNGSKIIVFAIGGLGNTKRYWNFLPFRQVWECLCIWLATSADISSLYSIVGFEQEIYLSMNSITSSASPSIFGESFIHNKQCICGLPLCWNSTR